MKCSCGNDRFYAHQLCRHDVIVDENNNFEESLEIYDSEHPYGPYTCTVCSKEYEELN